MKTEVAERDELAPSDALDQIAVVDEVVAAEGQEVGVVDSLRCRCQAEEELGSKWAITWR